MRIPRGMLGFRFVHVVIWAVAFRSILDDDTEIDTPLRHNSAICVMSSVVITSTNTAS
jgi:hypothetical protein